MIPGYVLLLVLLVLVALALVWWRAGLHFGPLPQRPMFYVGYEGPTTVCRCGRHTRGGRNCELKINLCGSYWTINLWIFQVGGPYCSYCFHGHGEKATA